MIRDVNIKSCFNIINICSETKRGLYCKWIRDTSQGKVNKSESLHFEAYFCEQFHFNLKVTHPFFLCLARKINV